MRAASSARGCCRKAGQRFLTGGQCDLFCTAFLPALFGLQYEAPAFVEVDSSVPRLSCLVTASHGTFDHVIIVLGRCCGGGGLGLGNELGGERGVKLVLFLGADGTLKKKKK